MLERELCPEPNLPATSTQVNPMKRTNNKRFTLPRETIRVIAGLELDIVVGGGQTDVDTRPEHSTCWPPPVKADVR